MPYLIEKLLIHQLPEDAVDTYGMILAGKR
jgi:hypothetical protein